MLVSIITGVVAALTSLLRLWWGNPHALDQVLWAEDGLFPLCIHKADALTCLTDPFAGYLLFLPRVIAWPVSWLPWEHWALAMNLAAAAILGLISALAVQVMRRNGIGWFVAVAVGLLPALAPMVGLEAINAVGSSYMLLLFLATLVIAFPPQQGWKRGGVVAGAILLLVTALTIPSAIVLVPLIVLMRIRTQITTRVASTWIVSVLIGLFGQVLVAVNAAAPRSISFGFDRLREWADAVPVSVLTYWPGLTIGEHSFFANFTLAPVPVTGWLFVAALTLAGVLLVIRGEGCRVGSGILLLAGVGLGLIPSAIGFTNNRYFVVPLLLWGSAVLVLLDPYVRRARPWVLAGFTTVVLVIWWPALPASDYRSTPAPPWSDEVARIEAKCVADPGFTDRPLFTPFWPPNWGDGLTEPSHPKLPCTIVWRWIDGS